MNKVRFAGDEITPSKVVCVGRNYVEHVAELGNTAPTEPVIFIKPNSAVSDRLIANEEEDIHYETEIAFIIEQGGFAGVGLGLDLTKRALQSELKAKGLPWERAKAFNHSAVFTEFVAFDGDFSGLQFELLIDGQKVQSGSPDCMLFKPNEVLAFIQDFLSLESGDIVMTGTPKGVGQVREGAVFSVKLFSATGLLVEKQWTAVKV